MNNAYSYINFGTFGDRMYGARQVSRGMGNALLRFIGNRIVNKFDQAATTSRARRDISRMLRESGTGTISRDALLNHNDYKDLMDTRTLKGYALPEEINRDMVGQISRDIGKRYYNERIFGRQDPNGWDRARSTGKGIIRAYDAIKDGLHQAQLLQDYRNGDRRAGLMLATRRISEFANDKLRARQAEKDRFNELEFRSKQLDLDKREREANLKWNPDIGRYESRSTANAASTNE